MINKLCIYVTLMCSFFFTHTALSAAPNVDLSPAQTNFSKSLEAVAEKEQQCRQQQIVIPASAFTQISASVQTLKIALSHYYAQAKFNCAKPAIMKYLLDAGLLMALDQRQQQKLLAGHRLMLETGVLAYKARQSYLQLPEKLRLQFEQIPQLQQPFNLIKTAENLGL